MNPESTEEWKAWPEKYEKNVDHVIWLSSGLDFLLSLLGKLTQQLIISSLQEAVSGPYLQELKTELGMAGWVQA